MAAVVVGLVLYWAGLNALFSMSFGVIAALFLHQGDALWFTQRHALIERQLADAIDLMVGALGAGAGVTAALEACLSEARSPLREVFEEVLGRLRYGDDAGKVFQTLSQRVPLETFLLFSTSLAVHWEAGGSLGHVLASVGRTIRDRIEIAGRIRSNAIQAQFSGWMVLAVTYLIAAIMWRSDPGRMAEFVRSPSAHWFIAGAMLMQAVGIVWMSAIPRMRM
jgi:tight adherence protein B